MPHLLTVSFAIMKMCWQREDIFATDSAASITKLPFRTILKNISGFARHTACCILFTDRQLNGLFLCCTHLEDSLQSLMELVQYIL